MKATDHKKYVILIEILFFIFFSATAQQKMVEGTVIDQKGEPVKNARVFVKENPGKSVRSDESEEKLIQTGYDVAIRKDELTSAVGVVDSDNLLKSSAVNPANALFGRIPGLIALENGGGSMYNDPTLFIRGVETFGNGSILILVDGFERPISSLSIHEIESIEILKDGAGLAKFGLRGANGVLLVTTKRGLLQDKKFSISYERGISQAFRLPNFSDAFGYATSLNQARINDGLTPVYSQAELSLFQSGSSPYIYPNVDWLQESLQEFGYHTNLNLSFQGGNKKVRYFALFNYYSDQGLFDHVNENEGYSTQLGLKKINLRTNLDIQLTNTTLFKMNIGGYLREENQPGAGLSNIMSALYSIPSAAFPVKTFNNTWGGSPSHASNPVAQISETGYGIQYTRELYVDGRLKQGLDPLIEGLSAEIAVVYDNSATYNEGKTKQFSYESINIVKDPATGMVIDTTIAQYGSDTELSYYHRLGSQWRHAAFESNLKYTKEWDSSTLNSMLLFQHDYLERRGQYNTFVRQLFLLSTRYSLLNRYYADFSLTYNGTNMLPKNRRFGLFPAISFAWRLANEKWFNINKTFNDLKIRFSSGLAGNDLISQNIYDTYFQGSTGYYYTENNTYHTGYKEGRLGTKNVTYESSLKTNLGIDAILFNNALEVTLDVFYNKRKNILVESGGSISSVIGATLPLSTAGKIVNRGFEIGVVLQKRDNPFKYTINGQFSFVRNKILEMAESYLPYDYLKSTGNSYGQAFGWENTGFFNDISEIENNPKQLFSEVRPGDVKYKDQNNDDMIDEYDKIKIGYSTVNPELYFSASFDFEYKGFGIDGLIQGVGNYTRYLNTAGVFWPLIGNTSITDFTTNSWTPETAETASLPRLTTVGNANNYRPNNIWLKDGAFVKLRSLGIYYNIPQRLIAHFNVDNIRLYSRGFNLFSLDKIKYADPESLGITYPTLTTFVFGIKIDF